MNVLLVINNNKDVDFSFSKQVIEYLTSKNVNVFSDDENVANVFGVTKFEESELQSIDFSLILGGDGTVLKYASKYGKCNFPFIGINLGRVGALSLLDVDNYKVYLDRVLNKDYHIEYRLGLDCEVLFAKGNKKIKFTCYNDIVLHRALSLKLLPILLRVNNGEDLINADGIVVSTPGGSSAYNASSGGPLLIGDCKSVVITPICPQSKIFIPLVVSDESSISLKICEKSDIDNEEVIVSGDGCYKYFISKNDEIDITKSKYCLKMIGFDDKNSLYKSVYKAVTSIKKRGEN